MGEHMDKVTKNGGDDPMPPPKKGIGWRGDTASTSNQDYFKDGQGVWHPNGGPYSGPPHNSQSLPPGAVIGK